MSPSVLTFCMGVGTVSFIVAVLLVIALSPLALHHVGMLLACPPLLMLLAYLPLRHVR